MNISISESDRASAKRIALKNLARFFKIPDWEIKDNVELFDDIKNITDPNAQVINNLLDKYFEAYDKWYNFYQAKKKNSAGSGIDYELNEFELNELGILIHSREESLDNLQLKFDELQDSQVSIQMFGTDIDEIKISK